MTNQHNGAVENFHEKGLNQCPECGGTYKGQNIYNHLRKVHNIWGGRSGRVRNDPRYNHRGRRPNATRKASTQALLPAVVARPNEVLPPPIEGLHFPENIKVGLGEDGSMWICEQVRAPRGRS
jgi:hypothetical protein